MTELMFLGTTWTNTKVHPKKDGSYLVALYKDDANRVICVQNISFHNGMWNSYEGEKVTEEDVEKSKEFWENGEHFWIHRLEDVYAGLRCHYNIRIEDKDGKVLHESAEWQKPGYTAEDYIRGIRDVVWCEPEHQFLLDMAEENTVIVEEID